MKTPGASYLRLRYAIALAMSTAPFVALDRAEAACDPATSSANPDEPLAVARHYSFVEPSVPPPFSHGTRRRERPGGLMELSSHHLCQWRGSCFVRLVLVRSTSISISRE
jgi:hypothetical protein